MEILKKVIRFLTKIFFYVLIKNIFIYEFNMNKELSKDGSKYITDEVFNSASHMVGAIFSLVGIVILIVKSSVPPRPWHIISFSVYGLSFFMVFLSSSLHHGINASSKLENFLRQLDYLAIFPLIAGTFTPVCLVLLRNIPLGWGFFGIIWGLCIIGIIIKSIFPNIPKWVTSTIYISMGWIGGILVISLPFIKVAGMLGLGLLFIGAVFYSVGFIIFNIEKPNPIPGKFGFHEIWHIFVLLGGFSHYFLMYFVILPHN